MENLKPRTELIVVLGHENSPDGTLSDDALSRVSTVIDYLNTDSSVDQRVLVATGGFANYYNVSNTPHGLLLSKEIGKHKITNCKVLPHIHSNATVADSSGTVDDALGVLRLLIETKIEPSTLTVVTNRFHRERTEWIFSRLFPWIELNLLVDERDGTLWQRCHEKRAFRRIKKRMPLVGALSHLKISEASTAMLYDELKHYDNLSYLALVPAFAVPYVWRSNLPISEPHLNHLLTVVVAMLLSLLFWSVYYRLAGTAASARRSVSAIQFILGQPQLGVAKNLNGTLKAKIPRILLLALLLSWALALTNWFLVEGRDLISSRFAAEATLSGSTKTIDGSTISVGDVEVGLQGIVAPPRGTKLGDASTKNLERLVGARLVTCALNHSSNVAGQKLTGVCSVKGRDLAASQVASGFARDCPKLSDDRYAEFELIAIASGRNLSSTFPLPAGCKNSP